MHRLDLRLKKKSLYIKRGLSRQELLQQTENRLEEVAHSDTLNQTCSVPTLVYSLIPGKSAFTKKVGLPARATGADLLQKSGRTNKRRQPQTKPAQVVRMCNWLPCLLGTFLAAEPAREDVSMWQLTREQSGC